MGAAAVPAPGTGTAAPPDRGGRTELAALGLAALALRPQLVGIGPLIPPVQDDLGMSHAASGLLGTIPVLCMGLFALPAARLAARWGTRRAIGACLATIAVAGLARAAAPTAVVLLLLTVPVGVGMGLCGALLPVAVKERFPRRPALGTSAYATGVQVGAVTSSLAVVGLLALGSWRLALAVLSVAAAAVTVAWLVLDREQRSERTRAAGGAEIAAVLRRPVTWVLVASFGLMGVVYYGLVAWLPDAYQEHGWSEAGADGLIAALSFAQVPGALAGGWLGHRIANRRALLTGAAACWATGAIGFAAVPGLAYAWALLAGLAMGILFTVMLTLPLDLSAQPTEAGAIAGVMLAGGYTIAALAPVLLGAVRDASGSFSAVLVAVAIASSLLVAVLALIPRTTRHGIAGVTT